MHINIDNIADALNNRIAELNKATNLTISDEQASVVDMNHLLSNCPKIWRLAITSNTIKKLPNVQQCPALSTLEINCSELTLIEKAHFPTSINSFYYRKGKLKQLPNFIWHSLNLSKIRLDADELTEIVIPSETQVECLKIYLSNLTKITIEEGQTKVRELDISSKRLTTIDKSLAHLRSVRRLEINAPISTVSCDFSSLPNLKNFYLKNWQLTDYTFLKQATYLSHLDIRQPHSSWTNYDKFQAWSNLPAIQTWKDLGQLSISGCLDTQISKIPFTLNQLRHIHIDNSKLTNLPEAFKDCPNLDSLGLSSIPPVSFAKCMKYLPHIRHLSLSGLALLDSEAVPTTELAWQYLGISAKEKITLRHLDFLSKMPKLERLNFYGIELSSPYLLLREKAVPIDYFHQLLPTVKYKKAKDFSRLCAAIAKSGINRLDQEFFVDHFAAKTKLDLNTKWDWTTLLKASNINLPSFKKKWQNLVEEKIAQQKNKKALPTGAVIYITGKLSVKKTELKKQVTALGMTIAPHFSDQVTHVLLNFKSQDYETLDAVDFTPILPAAIQKAFAAITPQFLKEQASMTGGADLLKNLEQLLASGDLSSVKVAAEMIKNGGMPDSLAESALIIQKTTSDAKIKKILTGLLEVHAPDKWKSIIRDRLSFKAIHTDASEVVIRKQFKTLSKRVSSALVGEFSCLMYKKTGKGIRYALTTASKTIKKQAYSFLLDKHHFDFSKGLGFAPKGTDLYVYSHTASSVALPTLALELGTIHSLNLSNCRYETIRKNIVNFKDLKRLDFSMNELTQIPDFFAKLQQLEALDLSNNEFKIFPEILTQLPNLKEVDLRQNQLTTVPAIFSKVLPNCKVLI